MHRRGDHGLDELVMSGALAKERLHASVTAFVQDDDLDDLLALDKCVGSYLGQGHRLVGVHGCGAGTLQRRLLEELPLVVEKGGALRALRRRVELVRLKPLLHCVHPVMCSFPVSLKENLVFLSTQAVSRCS